MRIASRSIVFICFFNLVRGQSDYEDSEKYALGDPEWWSERITKVNGKETRTFGLASEDSEPSARRWNSEEIGDSGRRPRPFASVPGSPETREQSRYETRRERFRDHKVRARVSNLRATSPSPILLPPYEFVTPVYRNEIFDDDAPSRWNNESSTNAGKSSGVAAPVRTGINEITKLNSSSNVKRPVESESSYRDDNDDSTKMIETKSDPGWIELVRESSVNVTSASGEDFVDRVEPNRSRSFYVDEERANERQERPRTATNRSNLLKNSRGNRKYQRDRFESERTFTRKRTFSSSSGGYDWQGRPAQRSNHFRFIDDPNGKAGAVPGVPGRDYPVHQEHTHHHLRNVVDRFPCPRTSKTHVYLADRASRCQIFYVCYGSNTGVPMVCPNGTLFSEPLQVCDWWFNVAC